MSYTDDNRYWQRWTITINGRTKEAVRNAMKKVTCNSFDLLQMDDIFSTLSGSTGIEDRKEGDKMAIEPIGACEVGWGEVSYKLDTVYKAVANTNKNCCRIYFKFFLWSNNTQKMLWVAQSTDGILAKTYHIATATEVHHVTNEGTWVVSFHRGRSPTWGFVQNDGHRYVPTISLATMTQYHLKPKYTKDDMVDTAIYGIDLQTAKRRRQGVITGIKEVKGKMAFEKNIYHIMFFNKKTEQIEFKKYVPAKDIQAAVMIAAQTYKDYNPDIHMVLVKLIDYSDYTPIK